MRPRTLLILFLLVAGLGTFVWFYERELPGSDERAERARRVFPELEAEEVDRLVLTSNGVTVELERPAAAAAAAAAGDDEAAPPAPSRPWRLVAPLTGPADGPAVDGLLRTVAGLEKERTLDDVAAAAVGLDPPRARLELRAPGQSRTLVVGGQVPASGGLIVATGEGPPYFVVAGDALEALDREPGDWRSRDLFPGTREAIDRVTVQRGAERLLLARRGEDFWVEAPYVDLADDGTVGRLLGALVGLRAESFVDAPPAAAEQGLDPAAVLVEVVLRDAAEPFRLALGAEVAGAAERRYARVGEQVVETTAALAEAVDREPAEWRSLAWSSLDVFELDRVEITAAGEEPLVLEQSEGEWLRDGGAVPYTTASDFLYALTGAKADRVGEETVAGEPQLTIELAGGARGETLSLFAPRDEGRPARVSGREVTLWLRDDGVAEIERRLAELRAAATTAIESNGGDATTGDDATSDDAAEDASAADVE